MRISQGDLYTIFSNLSLPDFNSFFRFFVMFVAFFHLKCFVECVGIHQRSKRAVLQCMNLMQ